MKISTDDVVDREFQEVALSAKAFDALIAAGVISQTKPDAAKRRPRKK